MLFSKYIKQIKITLFVLAFNTQAFSGLVISGKVLNKRGVPLPGANIMVLDSEFGTATGFDGSYILEIKNENLLSQTLQIRASYIGYGSS